MRREATDLLVRALYALPAALVLLAGVAVARHLYEAPPSGLRYELNSGQLLFVERGGAVDAAGLRPGDRLAAIGMRPLGTEPAILDGLLPVSVARDGLLRVYWVAADRPGVPWSVVALLLVAACLWLAGAWLGLFGPARAPARLFAAFALAAALALCCCVPADAPFSWADRLFAPALFGALLAYIWLQRSLSVDSVRAASALFSWEGLLSAQALLVLAVLLLAPRALAISTLPRVAGLAGLDIPISLIGAHLPAVSRVRPGAPAPLRRRVRVGLLVGAAAWLPALVVGWLPPVAGLLGPGYIAPIPPYAGALSLLVPAATYPAIVVRGDLFWVELAVRRLLAAVVAGGLLLALGGAVWWAFDRQFALGREGQIALGVGLALAGAPLFDPFRRRLQGVLDRRLAVEQSDYGPALQTVASALLLRSGEAAIARVLYETAAPLLGIGDLRVWLRDSDGAWRLFGQNMPDGVSGPVPVALQAPPATPFAPKPGAAVPQFAASSGSSDGLHSTVGAGLDDVALCVPIYLGDALRGLLLLGARRTEDPYRRPEREALQLLAQQVAAALQQVDLLGDLRARNLELAGLTRRLARAREEERKHLSHELHDDVAQDLIALTRQLRRYQQGALPDAIWQDMLAQAREALAAIRRICNDLRPATLDMGLEPALQDLVEHLPGDARQTDVRIQVEGEERQLDEERAFALYRVVQEALANMVKHAEAHAATVSLCYDPDSVQVQVRDDGRGFAVPVRLEDIPGDHLGLLGMRERLAELGGSIAVESSPGQGTLVRAWLPLDST